MKKLIFILPLLLIASMGLSQTFTEFYCDATVSANNTNVNAGSTTGAPVYGPSVNGNWNGTTTFTPTDGSTPASTVSAGMWASVYLDAAVTAVYIAQVTSVAGGANGAITLSTTAFSGTPPTSSATGRSIRVGGCWKGPYKAVGFPFGFMATTATNGTGIIPCVNFINTASYVVTAAITHNVAGPVRFQGYSSSPRDGGRATIDGGASGTGYALFTSSGADIDYVDFIFQNNGNSGTSAGVTASSGSRNLFRRVVVHDVRGIGFNGGVIVAVECEVYNANQSNTAATGGFSTANAGTYIRCISHDNAQANTSGFKIVSGSTFIRCVSDSNAADGALVSSSSAQAYFIGCDFYNNGGAGIEGQADNQELYIENCNFIKNTAFGITNNGALRHGAIVNCGFGAGTQANGGADIVIPGAIQQINNISYANDVTPWVDPANGDFRITLSAAKASGRGSFTQTSASYAGTVGYPDIGSAQASDTNSAGGSYTFSQ